jgi:thioredoxin reductase (NADPH)
VREASGPVVTLYTGAVLVDPSNVEVAEALGAAVRPPGPAYDVVIVGAGPAGLAAAVYGASEGLNTALLEREAFGGQAGTSSLIRNYLGFPHGVSGTELAWRAWQQAWGFGVHLIYGNPVMSLSEDGAARVPTLSDGSEVRSRAVILATGVSYRRLQAPGLEALAGGGVFYGAATVEAQAMAGTPVFVVGGGNSAGQAALHLSKYASTVTILVRSDTLAASMSQYLIREIDSAPNIGVRYRAEVAGAGGDGRLQHLDLRDRDSGTTERTPAAGLFILIGAEPFTGWLPETVARDQWGYILTGPTPGNAGSSRARRCSWRPTCRASSPPATSATARSNASPPPSAKAPSPSASSTNILLPRPDRQTGTGLDLELPHASRRPIPWRVPAGSSGRRSRSLAESP